MPPKTEVFKEILADFHERRLPSLTRRDISLEKAPSKITTLTGARRSGKTCLLYQIMQELLDGGTPRENILFVNFEDERLIPMSAGDLGVVLDAYFELYPAKKRERVYAFFDEIHNVPGWELFVRRIHDSENLRIFLTGSSSKLLSREIATSLRGRTLNYEVFPFSFSEFLRHKSITYDAKTSAGKAMMRSALGDYFSRGGFPEVASCSETAWRMILQDYINLIVYKDIVERHQIKNQEMIRHLVKFLLGNPAAPVTVNKLYRDFKSRGFAVSKDTLYLYLGHLEEAYSFFLVPIFSESIRTQNVNYRKLYAVDVGFVNVATARVSEKRGQLLENAVFLNLRRRPGAQIFYYRTGGDEEVDFLLFEKGRVSGIYQVTEGLEEPAGARAAVDSLFRAMEELHLSRGTIITRDEEKVIETKRKRIDVIPAWKWLGGLRIV